MGESREVERPRDNHFSPLFGVSQRLPPSNVQAEQALLGAIFANNAAFHRVVAFLKPEHFVDPIHGRIYGECAKLILHGHLADAVTLKAAFEHSGVLDEVGGTIYLAQLLTAMVGIINAGEYGRAIHDTWLRRQLISIGENVVDNAFGSDTDLDGERQIDSATDALMELSSRGSKDAPEISIGEAARLAVHTAEARARGELTGVLRSGLDPVDNAVGEWWPDCFYVLGGRPSMGKTTLVLQIALGVAQALKREQDEAPAFSGAGGIVAFFSFEMSAEQLGGWAVCHLAGVPNDVLRGREPMTTQQGAAMLHAQRELDALPLKLIDAVGMSGPAVVLRARAMHQRQRVRMVVLDHLQKVVSDVADRGRNRDGATAETSKTTSALKNLSRQLHCPVIALAQLGRDVDRRDDPRPRNSDLMYAGETDGDVLCFLYRKERYLNPDAPKKLLKETEEQYDKRRGAWRREWDECRNRAEFIVGKQRSGALSSCTLGFSGPLSSFYQLGSAAEAPPDLWDEEV